MDTRILVHSVILGVSISASIITSVMAADTQMVESVSSQCPALETSNGSSFNWSQVRTNEIMEDCLSDLARGLGGTDEMRSWLEDQGFFGIKSYSVSDQRVLVQGYWNEKMSGSRMPFDHDWPFWISWLNRDNTYEVSVAYKNGMPVEANASHNTK